jgi:hypothetical protein
VRRIVLSVLAVVTAFWLAPALHILPQQKRLVAVIAIFGLFLAIDLIAARRKAAGAPSPSRSAGPRR